MATGIVRVWTQQFKLDRPDDPPPAFVIAIATSEVGGNIWMTLWHAPGTEADADFVGLTTHAAQDEADDEIMEAVASMHTNGWRAQGPARTTTVPVPHGELDRWVREFLIPEAEELWAD